MLPKPKIVFLYSEVAGYFLACAEALSVHADVLVVRWPINSEAPFQFDSKSNITIVCKADYSADELRRFVVGFKPTAILASGWMDKGYLKIIKSFRKKIPAILTLDNHWTGNMKQRLAAVLSPFFLLNKFTQAWVPGSPQIKFAKALGFKRIDPGFYCADVPLHAQNYNESAVAKTKHFLYVGRYVNHKGIHEMWQAFMELIAEGEAKDWKMICVGTGDEYDKRIQHSQIEHLGFLQPEQLKVVLSDNPIYILPSKFEPWGVSVQEFAIAGCPLLISSKVGAAELFLEDSANGFAMEPNVASIKQGMKKMMALNEKDFNKMRQLSHKKGMAYTPEKWAKRLLEMIK